jgi:voltage-gated potassium channel
MASRVYSQAYVILALAVLILVIGVAGFTMIEDWSVVEALYMTVITITTVGFGEVKPLHTSGQIFTIFLVVCGVGIWAYGFGAFAKIILEGQFRSYFGRRRTERMIKSLKDHIIVCGFGRMGRLITREISREGVPFVVIEKDSDFFEDLRELDYHYIGGDATEEEVLEAAGVDRAKTLITVLPSDAGNVYVTLSARALNPALHIICRAENPGDIDKMKRAGASKVISPYEMGGRSMAQAALRPNVLSFFEMATARRHEALAVEELVASERSSLAGKTLLESRIRERYGVSVIAYRSPTDEIVYNPPPDFEIKHGTVLLVMGKPDGLKNLAEELLGRGSAGR